MSVTEQLLSVVSKILTVTQNEKNVYDTAKEAGVTIAKDAFWESYQNGGKRTNYACAFGGVGWKDALFTPKYDIRPTDAYMMFRSSGITNLSELPIALDFSKTTNMQYMFQWAQIAHIGTFDMSSMSSNTQQMFGYTYNLHTIDNIYVTEKVKFATDSFLNATALKNITFDGVIASSIDFSHCPLTVDSMVSIISHLKNYDLTGEEFTKTIKFSAACWDALEESGRVRPDGSYGEWVTYIDEVLCWNTNY